MEHLRGKFPAVFTRHCAFDALDDRGHRAAVIFELLRTIMNRNPSPSADVFIIGALVRVLESPPTADIINKNVGKLSLATLNVPDHLGQRVAPLDVQTALAL